jgi:TonB family protein
VKSLDKGLDENAIQAVQKYRFTPATKDGVAVAKDIKIEVNFQIY